VNLAEIRFGIELMSDARQRQKVMTMLRRMRRKPLLRIGAETAEVFGTLAARLTKSGRGHDFRVQDLWLAAQAIERKFTLLTADARDFRDVPGLKFLAMTGT
jgi:predicted nucleic acid-binding protein